MENNRLGWIKERKTAENDAFSPVPVVSLATLPDLLCQLPVLRFSAGRAVDGAASSRVVERGACDHWSILPLSDAIRELCDHARRVGVACAL